MKSPISIFIKRLKWSDYAYIAMTVFLGIIVVNAKPDFGKATTWVFVFFFAIALYFSGEIIYKALRFNNAKSNYTNPELESTNYEECIEIYTRKISNDPHNADNYLKRGNSYHLLGSNENAMKDFDKSIELSPDNGNGYLLRGESSHQIGDFENALIDFNRALEINPGHMAIYMNRAITKQSLEMYEEAEMDWTKLIEYKNDFYFAYAGRAETRRDSGKYEEAILDCDVLILNSERLESAYNIRGYCKSMLGNLDESISDYLSGYDVNKTLGVLYNAGFSYERANRYNDAVLLYNRVIDINSRFSPAYVSRGYIKYGNQDFFGALYDWKTASAIGNEKATALLEVEEVKAHDGALYLDYKKLVDWCKQQGVEEAKGLPLDLMFTVTTIVKTKEDMVSVGWKEEDIDDLPIAMIYPLVAQFETNILNTLEVKGNELIENRGMIGYDEIVFNILKLDRDAIDGQLNAWWPGYFNTTLKQMWGK